MPNYHQSQLRKKKAGIKDRNSIGDARSIARACDRFLKERGLKSTNPFRLGATSSRQPKPQD